MADNTSITEGTGTKVAADEVTYSGDTAKVQLVRLVDVTGAEGSKTVTTYTVPVTGTFWQATQPVSGTVSVSGSVAVTGTFWQATQPVSGTVAATQSGTWNIGSITTLPALPTGSNVIGAVTQSGAWNITNISGTISLPTGAATAANQSTLNTNIGSSADATVASGSGGSIAGYLRTIKDGILDTTTTSPVSVRTPCDVISVTPTLDTSIYASGDTLFATTAISGATRASDERAALQSVAVIDKDDQKPALRLLFFKANVTFGTINAAPSISDSDAANYLGHVDIAAADYVDLGGASVACAKGINLMLEAASGTSTVYVAGMLTAGTPTHTASGLVFNFGIVQS